MYKIYIDTTERFKNKIQLFKDEVLLDEMVGDLDVITSISSLLNKNKLIFSEINNFDVNEGPGSFTGIKIGVTVANILNWVKDADNFVEFHPKYNSEPNIFDTPWLEK